MDRTASPSIFNSLDGVRRFRLISSVLGLAGLGVAVLQGLRWEHVVAHGLLIGLPWTGNRALEFTRVTLPLWVTGMVVDGQRWLPLLGNVHTADIHSLEAVLFPAARGITWPEWFNAHPNNVADLVCGFAYAVYLMEFLLPAFFFYLNRQRQLYSAMMCAVIYLLVPAAPPWYVIDHGLGPVDLRALPSAAGASRFDALLGVSFFASFYARNPHVFGAMPSLHVAYPLLVVWYTWPRGWAWRICAVTFFGLVCFAAVYLAHHYILDVLAGFCVAIASARWGQYVARKFAAAASSA
jgi:membrane-associated phospholipid phosphatase